MVGGIEFPGAVRVRDAGEPGLAGVIQVRKATGYRVLSLCLFTFVRGIGFFGMSWVRVVGGIGFLGLVGVGFFGIGWVRVVGGIGFFRLVLLGWVGRPWFLRMSGHGGS